MNINLWSENEREISRTYVVSKLMEDVTEKGYYGKDAENVEEARRFRDIVEQIMRVAGAGNVNGD